MSNTEINTSEKNWPRSDGRTVPDGYFEDFARRVMAALPAEAPVRVEPRRTVWQKMRPYVYMAAMFAGVYLMMNIFTLTARLNNPAAQPDTSALFAELLNSKPANFADEYLTFDDPYIYEDLYEAGFEIPDNL